MRIVPFIPDHARVIDVQMAQKCEEIGAATPEYMAASSDAFTGMLGDKVLFCAGRSLLWPGRWIMWAILSEDAGPFMLRITRSVRRLLDLCEGDGRIEIMVRSDFDAGHRWMKLLGVPWHHHEEKFLPNGADADIYVRV